MKKQTFSRRLLAILLALTMCLSLLPAAALAAELDTETPTTAGDVDQGGEALLPPTDGGLGSDENPGDTAAPEGGEANTAPPEEFLPPPANDGILPIAEGDGYTQVTNIEDITSGGEFVLVAQYGENYYALGTTIAKKISATAVNVSSTSNTVTATTTLPVWTAASIGSGISLSNGEKYLGWSSSANFADNVENYVWNIRAVNNTNRFTFIASTTESASTVRFIQYRGTGVTTPAFGPYATTNTGGDYAEEGLLVFKNGDVTPPAPETKVKTPTIAPVNGSTVVPGTTATLSCGTTGVTYHTKTAGTDWVALTENTFTIPMGAVGEYSISVKATKAGLEDSDELELKYTILDTSKISFIADARAGAVGSIFTVSGTVTLIDGKNVYIQDSTAGIDVYCTTAPSGISRGDTVTAYGKYKVFNGLVELDAAEIVSSVSGTLPEPKEILISGINDSVESQLIKVVDAKVTAIDGTTVTLSQGEGADAATTTIYMCPTKENLTVGDTITVTAVVSRYNAFQLRVNSADDIIITDDVTPAPDPGPDVPPEELYKPANGDKVVIYHAGTGTAMSSTLSGTRLAGVSDKEAGAVLTVSVRTDGGNEYYTFTTSDGKLLATGTTGGNLTLEAPGTANKVTEWALEEKDGGWNISAVGKSSDQYIEFYQSNFTTYGYKSSTADIYLLKFYDASNFRVIDWTVDADVEQTIAQWGGGNVTENTTSISGDLLTIGDALDKNAEFTVWKNGVQSVTHTTGSGNHYVGGTGLGATANDYFQFKTSSKGWGGMTLSFRMYLTGSAPSSWQVQYSTNGTDFANLGAGSYTASYTPYTSSGQGDTVTVNESITNGLIQIKNEKLAKVYVSYTLSLPAGAENAEQLYIRLVAGNEKINGGTITSGGNTRIDTVKLVGSPVVSDSVTPYVQIDPDSTEDVGSGAAIALSTTDPNATIHYGWADNATGAVTYTTGSTATVPSTLPATLFTYASSAGKADSPVRTMTYRPAAVASVKMDPNGGGVYLGSGPVDVTLSTATDGATIMYSLSTWDKGEDGNPKYETYTPGVTRITLNPGFGTLTISAYAVKDGFTDSAVSTRTFTERGSATYQLFFGQMHSHTSYSDGAGTAEQAYSSVKALDQDVWNMDFLSVTDHSNSFDDAGDSKGINDAPTGSEWNDGKRLAREITTDGSFVGIFGYEMTWSNGLGHINTFNTTGYQDRTQSNYKTYSTALQNYYDELKKAPTSISQFNHPGTTFGDFSDFAHYDEEIDQLITLIEVGNGEGAIGSSGYFPSYEYYTRALDKGWHVAPTNNQDNHKGGWGTSNTGRDVVLVDELTEDAIYDAMRNYRVYATEDLNLEIYYTFDGSIMGTILDADSYGAGDKATISVDLHDKDDAGTAKVEVIVNGGKSLMEKSATCNETVTFEIDSPANYSYYYIKITQADGDIAVTAPVWVGKVEAVGITSLTAENPITITGQAQSFTLELYNNENKALEVSSITFTDKATGQELHTATDVTRVPKLGTASTSFTHTFTTDGVVTVTATVRGTLNDVEKVYTQDLELTVMPESVVSKVIVDGSHYNDYVTGYYGGNLGNMTAIAADLGVEVVVKRDAITSADLADCQLLVISAPARKSGTANAGDYVASAFEDSFIEVVKSYVQGGGSVVICGLADYQDKVDNSLAPAANHAAAQLNKLLSALGASMTINDDEAYDEVHNGGQAYRLYPETFNTASKWCKGIVTANSVAEGETYQTYSQYSGCTVNPGSGTWLVKGFDTTYSIDSDKDGLGGVEKGNAYFLACEDTAYGGTIFAAGGVFLSDFEVKAELDNIWDLPYANRTIFENILSMVRAGTTITPIAETRRAPLNKVFAIEGYVTSGTTNPNTTFFDSIYVQDASGGTDVFPYAAAGLAIGTKVRVLGYTDAYQGDRELQVISLEVLDDAPYVYQPRKLTTAQAADYTTYGGQLVSTSGTVSDIVMAGGRVSQFRLTDSSGVPATVFIDGYITNEQGVNDIHTWLKAGQTVSAVGLLYSHPEGDSDVSVPVLRVRNCDEITKVDPGDEPIGPIDPVDPVDPVDPIGPGGPSGPVSPVTPVTPVTPSAPSGSSSTPSTPSGLPVSTGSQSGGTTTTASPVASVSGGKATVDISAEIADEIIRQAVENNSEQVVIAPTVNGSVTSSEVTLPASAVKDLAEKTSASLTVTTPVASAAIANQGLKDLAGTAGAVTIAAEKSGNTVTLSIIAGGQSIANVSGGVVLTVPAANAAPGTVAMLVHDDGTRETIRKSVAKDGGVVIPLSGSARVELVDNSKSFADVPASSWAADAVAFASAHELFGGTGEGIFSPNLPMTRGMLSVVLHNLEGNPSGAGTTSFTDVESGKWYTGAISWAAANGIIGGYGDGRFGPNDSITREQLAVMLWRYAGSPAPAGQTLSFADAGQASGYALEALRWAVEQGIINGDGSQLNPKGLATRAQVAQMLANYMTK